MKRLVTAAVLLCAVTASAEAKGMDSRDIVRLRAFPTDSNCEAFDAKYGDGAAASVMNLDRRKQPSKKETRH
ncbi:hypothetical protein [Bradyrhizobium sp. USDA 4508]